ncbi:MULTISPECIES: hypothetical protein [Mycobacterium]|uniref:Uncharacterized protein n=1 Tax=Mycobacterium syngnathidarum TaxID=1908205 RepID=A0A1Q9W8Z7_9MYCO|nr:MULTISPECIES: hypothetical protein [Mycobacterium]MCG7611280.1 hypothetical protein [Mycobacterium sp. CnD-18-1]OHT80928.1 hypothetical protein BKG61_29930 [Mycobacterium syngnathidarum]OLT95182.1 hypothetical protein BKG60_18050 [Mycobacterium syngnathidarum]
MGTPQTDKLIAAIIAGEGPIDELRADALAEHASASIVHKVHDAVFERSIHILHQFAPYPTVQKKFNDVWGKFAKTADLVNVDETDSEVIGGLDQKQLAAWRDAKNYSGELNKLIDALTVAAQLSGQGHPPGTDGSAPSVNWDANFELGLVVDPTGLHVRRLWEAYSATGRCGAWAGLHRLGAKVGAKDLADYEPQRRPRPTLERRTDRGLEVIDPEDDLVETAASAE